MDYLGHVVSAKGLQVDPKKTESVSKWLTPLNPKELKAISRIGILLPEICIQFCTYCRSSPSAD